MPLPNHRRSHSAAIAALLTSLLAVTGTPAEAVRLPAGHRQVLADPAGQSGAWGGVSVAIDGDTAVAGVGNDGGAGTHRGSVVVFTRDPATGWWQYRQKVTDADADDYDHFGNAVALDGDTLVVGAPLDDGSGGPGSDRGRIHWFTRSASGTWGDPHDRGALTPEDGAHFGASVDLDGATIVAGAPYAGAGQHGAVVVLTLTETGSTVQELPNPSPADRDHFGISVSIDGDRLVVGSPGESGDRGAMHYYVRRADGYWYYSRPFTDPEGSAGDRLGRSVAIDWPIVVAGAPGDDDDAANGGAVHAYTFEYTSGPSGAWVHRRLPSGGDLPSEASLGWAVAIEGGTVVGGAPGDSGIGTRRGALHVFRGGPSEKAWTHEQTLVNPDGGDGDRLAYGVAVHGEWILAGAPGEFVDWIDSGVVHAFAETGRPVVDLVTPADGARFPIHSAVAADYECTDPGGSGIASCLGTVADGAPIDTSAAGEHTFSVTAFDAVGNTTTVTHTYVVPTCEGRPVTLIAAPGVPLEGTGGADVMLGTDGPDEISGLGGDDTICGLGGDDLILGGPGDDRLSGGDGNDKLRGAAGDDRLLGGAGSDRLLPEAGNDILDGGAGSDIADYLAARGPVEVNLIAGITTYTTGAAIWTHWLRSIEKADGSVYDDTLMGDDRRNVLRGKQGDDTILGNGGDDDLIGGTGDDRVWGGDGDDLVKGQADDDVLWGEAGRDRIVGGAGNDTLGGGSGDDTLIGGLRVHRGVFSNTIDGGPGDDICRWEFDHPTNC